MVRNLKMIHLLVFLIFIQPAYASPCFDKNVTKIFQANFHNDSVYKKGSCPTNVWNFLKILENCQVPLADMKVIFITEDNFNITLDQGRGGADSWFFHVVLSWNDFILDFDYTNEPQVIDKKNYFKKALATQATMNWSGIRLRILPAPLYSEKYETDNTAAYGFYYWLLPERSSFPETTILEFIN